ncbi:MAG TPA: HNH endonuclease signature motif containing protein [Tepidisphaeraceae bacterium]|nr:HNH endonuclease signature motif containing protein [Tepidisphaeraceae bacterium]
MDAALHKFVRDRAANRCEYCLIPQHADPFFTFHIEHIIARQHGGPTTPDNLALACHHCNLHKGPNLTTIDSDTGSIVTLFNPRVDQWNDHFTRQGPYIRGNTPTGRATARLLAMNTPPRLELR